MTTPISAMFFTVVGLLILSGDIQANGIAVAVVVLTVAVIQWYNYLSETHAARVNQKRADEWYKENRHKYQTEPFDQEATQTFDPYNITPDTDWTK